MRGRTRFYGDSIKPPAETGSDGADGCTCDPCPDRARVTYLERRLLDAGDEAESDKTTIRVQLERLTELREKLAGWKKILSNPKLKPADRIVAIPVVEQVREAQKAGQDEVHVRYPGIVNGWGIPESTVQKSVAVVTEMVGAALAKRNEPDKPILVETKHGPKEVTPWKTIVSATVEGDLYAAVGSYDPGLPQRGGKRTPLPQCQDHPTADVIVRSVTQCATCRKPIAPAQERTIRRQNEVVKNPPPAPVDEPGTYCRQNEVVTGHDGEEQSERAAKVIPIGASAARLRRQDAELGRIRMTRPPTQEVPAPPGCTGMNCAEPVAPGDKLYCAAHRAEADQVLMPWELPAAMQGASGMNGRATLRRPPGPRPPTDRPRRSPPARPRRATSWPLPAPKRGPCTTTSATRCRSCSLTATGASGSTPIRQTTSGPTSWPPCSTARPSASTSAGAALGPRSSSCRSAASTASGASATIRRPPPDEADRCDVCGARGVVTFVPFAMRQGPALVIGDACPDCAACSGSFRRRHREERQSLRPEHREEPDAGQVGEPGPDYYAVARGGRMAPQLCRHRKRDRMSPPTVDLVEQLATAAAEAVKRAVRRS